MKFLFWLVIAAVFVVAGTLCELFVFMAVTIPLFGIMLYNEREVYVIEKNRLQITLPWKKSFAIKVSDIRRMEIYKWEDDSIRKIKIFLPTYKSFTLHPKKAEKMFNHLLRINPTIEVEYMQKVVFS